MHLQTGCMPMQRALLVVMGTLTLTMTPIAASAQNTVGTVGDDGTGEADEVVFAEEQETKKIVLTGSRIGRKDFTASSSVIVITKQELDAAGMMSIGDILQDLPFQSNADNTQLNLQVSGEGSTRINLRGIGSGRTLVLLNGRRFPNGGLGADDSVDLNSIPTAIIERVEVLKEGACSIYGADAIAGVVNIITRKGFEGVDTSLYIGGTSHGDGLVYDLNLTTGHRSENGTVLFSAGVYEQKEIWAGDRGYSEFDYQIINWDRTASASCSGKVVDGGLCEVQGGSFFTPEGSIFDFGIDSSPEWDALNEQWKDDPNYDGTDWFNDPVVGWRPYNPNGTSDAGTGDKYNYQPKNYLVTPQKRYGLFLQGDYRLGKHVKTYVEASYVNRQSEQRLAPEPLDSFNDGIIVSGDNHYNPFKRDFLMVTRRMIEAGAQKQSQDLDTLRFTAGLTGSVPDDLGLLSSWVWDLNYTYGRTEGTNFRRGHFNRLRLAEALGPSFEDEHGNAFCGTPGNVIHGCVPLNLFGGQNQPITREMLDYIALEGIQRGYNELESIHFSLGGDVYRIPFGGMIGFSLGYTYREESGGVLPNPLNVNREATSAWADPLSGQIFINEGFVEVRVPLLTDLPGAELLELQISGRISHYSTFGAELTWKAAARWQVVNDLALRGTYARALGAPTLFELYSRNTEGYPLARDPCVNAAGVAAENCQSDGVPAGLIDHGNLRRATFGGNPNLDSETAHIMTAGLVYTPSFLAGFMVAVELWDLDLENTIMTLEADVILNQCFTNPTGARRYCDLITRDPALGYITHIDNRFHNVGGLTTWGIDGQLRYVLPNTPVGDFSFHLESTYTADYTLILASKKIQQQGRYVDQLVLPDWRFRLSTIWSRGDFGAGLNMRYIGPLIECETSDCTYDSDGTSDTAQRQPHSRTVDSNLTLDLWVAYTLESMIGTTKWTVGVNNLLDAQPARIYNGYSATSDARAYDFVGRFVYTRLTQKF